MKLELKHIAPYLPYGLKVYRKFDRDVYPMSVNNYTNSLRNGINVDELFYNIIEYKPILRPLIDLRDYDFEVNEHYINEFISEKHKVDFGIFSYYKGEIDIQLDGDVNVQYDQNKSIPFNVIIDIQTELLKAHYDVFGLIEKGLAIDINTLNNKL